MITEATKSSVQNLLLVLKYTEIVEKPICQWKLKTNYRMEMMFWVGQLVENLNSRFKKKKRLAVNLDLLCYLSYLNITINP